jgi:hypothetical protein
MGIQSWDNSTRKFGQKGGWCVCVCTCVAACRAALNSCPKVTLSLVARARTQKANNHCSSNGPRPPARRSELHTHSTETEEKGEVRDNGGSTTRTQGSRGAQKKEGRLISLSIYLHGDR